MSRVTADILPGYLHHRLARRGLLIIVDNAITYKAQRHKMPEELKLAKPGNY